MSLFVMCSFACGDSLQEDIWDCGLRQRCEVVLRNANISIVQVVLLQPSQCSSDAGSTHQEGAMRANFVGVVAAEDHGKILGEFASATRQKIKQRPSILRKSHNATDQTLLPTAGITRCSKLPQNHV